MIVGEKRIRVLVVDDSAFMRKVLHELISSDPQMEVVGQARDGRDAVALAESLQPDVISMDLRMPHMDGLEATELIMARNPRPIVIVSSESLEGATSTLRALELGAIDFVAKPSGGVDLDMNIVRDELTRRLKMAARVRVVRTATLSKLPTELSAATPRSVASVADRKPVSRKLPGLGADGRFPIVVIAASTGGPAALMRLVPSFPKDFPAAVLVVLHMPANFTTLMGQQLAQIAALRVKEAERGEIVQPGTLYVCPGSHHLRVSLAGRILLDSGVSVSGYRPSADLALETVAAYAGPLMTAVVLTGMGNDAARGVRAVKTAGGLVIAQDEHTSVIFGMPAAAIRTGAVDQVLALDQIYPWIEKHVFSLSCGVPQGSRG